MSDVISEIIPFTHSEIEPQVKKILLAKGLTDILYPGSTTSQIADIMTYLIHVLNTNTAMNLQEVILHLASKRINVLFGARQLGYEATQKTSYKYNLNISFKRNENVSSDSEIYNVLLPKYTKFFSNGNTYYYLGQDIYVEGITNSNRFDKSFTIEVKEGDLLRYADNSLLQFRSFSEDDGTGNIVTKQNYLIPFENIEDDGIEAWLTYIDDYGTVVTKEYWTRHEQFLIDSTFENSQRKFVRLQNIFLQMPSIFFEIGGYGNPIRVNTLIECNVLISKGKDGVAKEQFTIVGSLSEQINIAIGEVTHYGTNEESIDSIKENAPIFHNSANRAVTALDYVAISQRHNAVKSAAVWGIEDEYLLDGSFASVFFSFIPARTIRKFASVVNGSTQNADSENISNHMQYNLQYLPYRPFIDGVLNPDTDSITYPQTTPPVSPEWIPQPINFVSTPLDWIDYETNIGNPPIAVVNPGQKPLTKTQEDRNLWLINNNFPIMPTNWVENPMIDGIGNTVGLGLIQSQIQIDTHNNYKNTLNTVTYNMYVANDQAWYASLSPLNTYFDWIHIPEVILYIEWLQDYYLYNTYLSELTLYNSKLAEYDLFLSYIETPEGIEYINYRNSLPPTRELEDDNYNLYLTALNLYNNNVNELNNIVDNWYLNETLEIYKQPNKGPDDTSVFTALEPFKIMTMQHNHRQPAYMNFDYEIKIIKYNLSRPTSEINETVFNIIDNYFKDYVEKFNFEYLASNLQRRIDYVLGDSSGIEISLTNSISLNEVMYDRYSLLREGKKINFTLALPYEKLYSNGLDFDGSLYLPKIDTQDFLSASVRSKSTSISTSTDIQYNDIIQQVGGNYFQALFTELAVNLTLEVFTDVTRWKDVGTCTNKDLYCLVDIGGGYLVPPSTIYDKNILIPIYLGDIANNTIANGNDDPVVGRYIIRNDKYQEIAIELFFDSGVAATYPVDISNPPIPVNELFLDYGYGYINITYPTNIDSNSDNIPFKGYTIPRLRQVHFNVN